MRSGLCCSVIPPSGSRGGRPQDATCGPGPGSSSGTTSSAKKRKTGVELEKLKDPFEKVGAANVHREKLKSTGDEWMNTRREAELDMHLDVYASGSSNVDRIVGRAILLRNMYQDLANLRIDVTQLTDWDAALWTRSRVKGGTKTAGALARTTLQLAGRFTGNVFFWNSSLVRAQAFPKNAARETSEAPKSAIPPTWGTSRRWSQQ